MGVFPDGHRQQPRWWMGLVAIAVVAGFGSLWAAARVPVELARHDAFLARAVPTDARITGRRCLDPARSGRRCANTISYAFDGTRHVVRRGGWNRLVGDQLTVLVDPDDPEHFVVEDLRTGSGSASAFLAVVLALLAGVGVVSARGTPVTAHDGSTSALHRNPLRWVLAALVVASASLVGLLVAGATSVGDETGVVLVGAGAVVAGAVVWWLLRRRPAVLVLGVDDVGLVGGHGAVAASVRLGPGAVWTEYGKTARERSWSQSIQVTDGDQTVKISTPMWGRSGRETATAVTAHLIRSATPFVPWVERGARFRRR